MGFQKLRNSPAYMHGVAVSFDPFGDGHRNGYLKNKFGLTSPNDLKTLEAVVLPSVMRLAMNALSQTTRLDLSSWSSVHQILFGRIYPWAGEQRKIDVHRGAGTFPVRFNRWERVEGDAEVVFAEANASNDIRPSLGQIYGELAFNHPLPGWEREKPKLHF